jgi:hypothetical protein
MNHFARYQSEARARLNQTEPQYPPDSYFIKADRQRLQSYLDNRERIQKAVQRGTPRYKTRIALFDIR